MSDAVRRDHDGPRRRRPLSGADRRPRSRTSRPSRKSLGGSPTNVAVAAARLGARAAVITKVGDDPFGPYVRAALEGFGVDPRWVGTDPELRTPLVFCEIHPPDDFPLLFYREPKAPDMNLARRRARPRRDPQRRACSGPPAPGSRTSRAARADAGARWRRAAGTRVHGGITVHDLDHRPMFWRDEAEAGRHGAREALAHADRGGRQPRRGRGGRRHPRPVGGVAGAARAGRRAGDRQARPRGRARAHARRA